MLVIDCIFVLPTLRRKCNGVCSKCFLMDFCWGFGSKIFSRNETKTRTFSLTRLIIEDLGVGKWPTSCLAKRKAIKAYVQNIQTQVLTYRQEERFDFIVSHVFDIKTRIFAIDSVFMESKSSSFNQFGYSDLALEEDKFVLLKETKLDSLSKLPICKVVMIEIPKVSGGKKSLWINMPVDKVLQRMFITFLDSLIEEKLKPDVFAFRKGRDVKMAVASLYFKLSRTSSTKYTCLCSVTVEKCFDDILHDQIIKQYPFPKNYKYLLLRWLTPNRVSKNQKFKNLGRIYRGVCKNSFLGLSIASLMLSNCRPHNIFQEKQRFWAEVFSYADSIVLISNNVLVFHDQFVMLKKNLTRIGLSLNRRTPIKTWVGIRSVIKFQYLGFEFIVMQKRRLRQSSLITSMKYFRCLNKKIKRFGILLRPQTEKVKAVKKRLKTVIKKILHQPRNQIYKTFNLINSILLGWGSYYYFNQGCTYGKRLDNFVFIYLKKILVKKFRYNGLLRPKWVAYNFLGLDKINPNGHKWQPRVGQYVKNSLKILRYVYVWFCSDFFYKSSITSFFLKSKLCKKNYYAYRIDFDKNLNQLITDRLKSDLKVKLYNRQSGLCAVCNDRINERELLTCSPKINIHITLLRNASKEKHISNKSYQSFDDKVLLHGKCYSAFRKNRLFLKERAFRFN